MWKKLAVSLSIGVLVVPVVAARELALKQGVGVVLSGSIERRSNGYEISAKAVQTVTGNEIATGRPFR